MSNTTEIVKKSDSSKYTIDFDQVYGGPADRHLGVIYTTIEKNLVVAEMKIEVHHTQPFGILHGGVSVLLCESVGSVGANMNVPEGMTVVGLDINANHIASGVVGDTLVVTGKPFHLGRRSQVWEVIVRSKTNPKKLICVCRFTAAVVQNEVAASKSYDESNRLQAQGIVKTGEINHKSQIHSKL